MTLGAKKFCTEGLPGVFPIVTWIMAVLYCYAKTEWAVRNPGLLVLLMMPSYCLINSKMIVCSFTAMEIKAFTFDCFNIVFFFRM